MTPERNPVRQDTLTSLLGGRRGAADATIPLLVFIGAWLATGNNVGWGVVASLAAGLLIAVWRIWQKQKPRSVLLGLLGVCVAGALVLYTGRAEDILLPRILANAASAIVWAVSIVLRRPLLGLIVGALLGQKTSWRSDGALLRAYAAASWVWVATYLVRVAILTPMWVFGFVVAGGLAQVVLSWPLLIACLVVSGSVMKAALPQGHPGFRHPQTAGGGADRSHSGGSAG
ncbi:DUF3159 domain-containing protein [Natronoglycomyces albus]|uniref:DUF3159 domain-containing protein n=1 Tax=Natronoglycomyces albus TaxID=2811108 RepID=A0A895XWF9_9ACTN|nr:DUF3159 domain-containing protein [Natronoglycomyces albus]QSB06560.1 DUF3159 domain-containing protein [Natronoglycomyces albus]